MLDRKYAEQNITMELRNSKGLKNKALSFNLSPKYPMVSPPMNEPVSTIEEMYPFWDPRSFSDK